MLLVLVFGRGGCGLFPVHDGDRPPRIAVLVLLLLFTSGLVLSGVELAAAVSATVAVGVAAAEAARRMVAVQAAFG